MRKWISVGFLAFFVIISSSCMAHREGDTLQSFTYRMNQLSDSYKLSENGYILDLKSNTLSRFYNFSGEEILLRFKMNDKNILTEMNIVFTEQPVDNSDEFIFIKNCICAYIDDKSTEDLIFSEKSLSILLKEKSNETVEINKSDIQFLLDVTDSGTVITVVKNNL